MNLFECNDDTNGWEIVSDSPLENTLEIVSDSPWEMLQSSEIDTSIYNNIKEDYCTIL